MEPITGIVVVDQVLRIVSAVILGYVTYKIIAGGPWPKLPARPAWMVLPEPLRRLNAFFDRNALWLFMLGTCGVAGMIVVGETRNAKLGDVSAVTLFLFWALAFPLLWLAWELRPPRRAFSTKPLPGYRGAIVLRVLALLWAVISGSYLLYAAFDDYRRVWDGDDFFRFGVPNMNLTWGALNLWAAGGIGRGLLFRQRENRRPWPALSHRQELLIWFGVLALNLFVPLQILGDLTVNWFWWAWYNTPFKLLTDALLSGAIIYALLSCAFYLRPGADIRPTASAFVLLLLLLFLDVAALLTIGGRLWWSYAVELVGAGYLDPTALPLYGISFALIVRTSIYVGTLAVFLRATWKLGMVFTMRAAPAAPRAGELGDAHFATLAEIQKKTNLVRQ